VSGLSIDIRAQRASTQDLVRATPDTPPATRGATPDTPPATRGATPDTTPATQGSTPDTTSATNDLPRSTPEAPSTLAGAATGVPTGVPTGVAEGVPPGVPPGVLDVDIGSRHRAFTVEFDGPLHYLRELGSQSLKKPARCVKGSTQLKHFLLRKLGHILIVIPYWEWDAVALNATETREYLRRKLYLHLEDVSSDVLQMAAARLGGIHVLKYIYIYTYIYVKYMYI